jgi:hypothetical protein
MRGKSPRFGIRISPFVIQSGIRVSEFLQHSAFGALTRLDGHQNPNDEEMPKPESPNE